MTSKRDAIGIITAAAKGYHKSLCGKQFLIACDGMEFREVAFMPRNFSHFTGLVRRCSATRFYDLARAGHLSERDFDFDDLGNAQRKLAVIGHLPDLFNAPALYGLFLNSGLYISADYFVGKSRLSVGFREGRAFDVPVSLYNEDIRKLTYQPRRIIAVWEKPIGAAEYTALTYSRIDEPGALLAAYYEQGRD